MGRYRIQESVGTALQSVHSYEDLEIHHPSKRGNESGRVYANIDGNREEVLRQRTSGNQLMVSKDFILTDSITGSSRVRVPAPVSGYVGRVDEANGLVAIYDHRGGELVAQIRHMDLRASGLREGQFLEYGEPLGFQGGYGRGNPRKFGVHVHVDFNERHISQLKKYIRDLDAGAITTDHYPSKGKVQVEGRNPSVRVQNNERAAMKEGSHGAEVRQLQRALDELGYRSAGDRPLGVDGDFGSSTKQAVMAFQQAHGLHVDGIVGMETRNALLEAGRAPLLSEKGNPNFPLFHEAQQGVRQLPPGTFRNESEMVNVAAALAQRAKEGGMSHIDHVLINTRGDGVFAVQGNPLDSSRHVVLVDKAQATAQSVARSTELASEHDAGRRHSAQVQAQAQHQEHRAGLSMAMRP